jgi:hypothetical protein
MQPRKVEKIEFLLEGGDPDDPQDRRLCWKFDLSDQWDYYEFGKLAGQSFAIPKPPPPQGQVRGVVLGPGPAPGPNRR